MRNNVPCHGCGTSKISNARFCKILPRGLVVPHPWHGLLLLCNPHQRHGIRRSLMGAIASLARKAGIRNCVKKFSLGLGQELLHPNKLRFFQHSRFCCNRYRALDSCGLMGKWAFCFLWFTLRAPLQSYRAASISTWQQPLGL